MDFDYYFKKYDEEYGFNDSELCGFEIGFQAGQQSKQAEIDKLKMSNHYLSVQVLDAEAYAEYWQKRSNKSQAEADAFKARIQELWTELDDHQSKEYIIERCESIIKELLK